MKHKINSGNFIETEVFHKNGYAQKSNNIIEK
jgi:hypothetical protein